MTETAALDLVEGTTAPVETDTPEIDVPREPETAPDGPKEPEPPELPVGIDDSPERIHWLKAGRVYIVLDDDSRYMLRRPHVGERKMILERAEELGELTAANPDESDKNDEELVRLIFDTLCTPGFPPVDQWPLWVLRADFVAQLVRHWTDFPTAHGRP